jgi:HSP20 family molecular chaperone IbpA
MFYPTYKSLFSRDFIDDFTSLNCYRLDKNKYTFDGEKITLELPGVKKENIKAFLTEEGFLDIEWVKESSIIYNGKESFFVGKNIEDAEASLQDGVLQIHLKPKEKSIKKIEIK